MCECLVRALGATSLSFLSLSTQILLHTIQGGVKEKLAETLVDSQVTLMFPERIRKDPQSGKHVLFLLSTRKKN